VEDMQKALTSQGDLLNKMLDMMTQQQNSFPAAKVLNAAPVDVADPVLKT